MAFYDIRHDKVTWGASHLSAATGLATAVGSQQRRVGLRRYFYDRRHVRANEKLRINIYTRMLGICADFFLL